MTINEFRKHIKTQYPNATIKIKTVSFSDLARISRQFMTVEGVTCEERWAINKLLPDGIMPDERICTT
jgi:hypothetical protein